MIHSLMKKWTKRECDALTFFIMWNSLPYERATYRRDMIRSLDIGKMRCLEIGRTCKKFIERMEPPVLRYEIKCDSSLLPDNCLI